MENTIMVQPAGPAPGQVNKKFGKWGIYLAFPIAFLYVRLFLFGLDSYGTLADGIGKFMFCLLFILWNECVLAGRLKQRRLSVSDCFWYGSLILTAALLYFAPEYESAVLILHIVVIYATAVRSRGLLMGQTSCYIIGDFFITTVIRPFANFARVFQDIRLFSGEKKAKGKVVIGVIAVLFVVPAFFIALYLLGELDATFGQVLSNITDYISEDEVMKDVFSIFAAGPVGMFLYGMLSGCARKDEAEMLDDGRRTDMFFDKLRAAPVVISRILLILFDLLYIVFFCFRGNYYFDAFSGKIGEGFTLAEYARQGFFELCGIMAVNLFVFCVIRFLTLKEEYKSVFNKVLLTLLMCQSLIFAVSSLSKLVLYFSIYGYTAKRLMSMWGTIFLGAGCILVIISLFIDKKDYMRIWTVIIMSTYIIVCIVSGIFSALGSKDMCEVQLEINNDVQAVTWTFYDEDYNVVKKYTEPSNSSSVVDKNATLFCEKPGEYSYYTIEIIRFDGDSFTVDNFHEHYKNTIVRITENDNNIYHSSIR
ncbi:MAG: DUF4173 domain-containing protein [Clostridiales bacterium]|nr:DUF4173 domain-containing protein [Clostridiales bacterium]